MANDKLSEQSMDFAVQIINLVKQLKEQRESIISNQIGRSGTSIGANIREAKYAHGTADFISKMQIMGCDINPTSYSKLEGQVRSATDKEVFVISNILNVPMESL